MQVFPSHGIRSLQSCLPGILESFIDYHNHARTGRWSSNLFEVPTNDHLLTIILFDFCRSYPFEMCYRFNNLLLKYFIVMFLFVCCCFLFCIALLLLLLFFIYLFIYLFYFYFFWGGAFLNHIFLFHRATKDTPQACFFLTLYKVAFQGRPFIRRVCNDT